MNASCYHQHHYHTIQISQKLPPPPLPLPLRRLLLRNTNRPLHNILLIARSANLLQLLRPTNKKRQIAILFTQIRILGLQFSDFLGQKFNALDQVLVHGLLFSPLLLEFAGHGLELLGSALGAILLLF